MRKHTKRKIKPTQRPITFREKIIYRLEHPSFIAKQEELDAERHKFDFSYFGHHHPH